MISGLYGAGHNQVSYTVSNEYFTEFKFEQFEIAPAISGMFGAALVGWQASWWMGAIIGMFVIPFGLLIRDPRAYFLWMLRVFGLILITTIGVGLVALLISFYVITPQTIGDFVFRDKQLADPVAFLRAGTMHNASYFGGLLGILIGLGSILRRFLYLETGSSKI